MYSRKRSPHYVDYTDVAVETVPGLSYSIAELLQRVVRNQPIPMMVTHDDSGLDDPVDPVNKKHTKTDDEVLAHMDSEMANPLNNEETDMTDVSDYLNDGV